MENYKLLLEEDDSIDMDTLDVEEETLFLKKITSQKEQLLSSLKNDYMDSLRENYDADEKLFHIIDELIEESEDQEKLLKILDSL